MSSKNAQGERAFWESVANTINPGWAVQASDDLTAGRIALASADVRIYVVDTASDWIVSISTSQSELRRAHESLLAHGERRRRVLAVAGEFIVEKGSLQLDAQHPDARKAASLAMAALSITNTYDIAAEKIGSLAGHWMYIAYRLRDQSTLSRPVLIPAEGSALLNPDHVRVTVQRVVVQDTTEKSSSVGRQIIDGGGAILSPGLEEVVRQSMRDRDAPRPGRG